jgi:hypothetical protein
VIRETGKKLVLKELPQLKFRLGNEPFIEFHMLLPFAVKGQGFFAAMVDYVNRKLQQIVDSLVS